MNGVCLSAGRMGFRHLQEFRFGLLCDIGTRDPLRLEATFSFLPLRSATGFASYNSNTEVHQTTHLAFSLSTLDVAFVGRNRTEKPTR